jgi:hypothetical protein
MTVIQVAQIAMRMISVISTVHEHGIVHGDTGNVRSWVLESVVGGMRISNFRKSCLYVDPITMDHLEQEEEIEFVGNVDLENFESVGDVIFSKDMSRFKSSSVRRRSVFTGGTSAGMVTRRDDMANIAEILLNLLVGDADLFPDRYTARNSERESVRVAKRKRGENLRQIFDDRIPSVFIDFYNACLGLDFDETIDYKYWIVKFRDVAFQVISTATTTSSLFVDPSAGDMEAFIALKNVNREHGKILYALVEKNGGDWNDACMTVLRMGHGIVVEAGGNGGVSLAEIFERDRTRIVGPRLGHILIRLIKLVRAVHESGIVHGGIGTDSFVWIGDLGSGDLSGDYWRIGNFQVACSFLSGEMHAAQDDSARCVPIKDWNQMSVYGLSSGGPNTIRSRRDDAFQFMEMAMDLAFGFQERFSREEALSWKKNRHRNTPKDYQGILSELYYRTTLLGFADRPDYEGAIVKLVRRLI